jgi:hypothetical protein
MSKTEIDTIRMVREIRDAMYEKSQSMTRDEYRAYINAEAAKMQREVEQILARREAEHGSHA